MSSEKKNNDYLLEVEHLKQYFPVHQGFSTAESSGRYFLCHPPGRNTWSGW
jgi:hypothetical protein